LALTGNMSTGGTSIDRTDEIHPDNFAIASQAARIIGLDVAGIDFLTPDITRSVREVGGAICEVNAGPGFRMHTHPTEGIPRDVARPVLDLIFAPGSSGRVPIVAVTGTNGKTTTCRMVAHILKVAGRKVGLTSTEGIEIDGTQIAAGDMSGPGSARMVLQNPAVDAAVLETARGGLLRSGLGYDRADVAIVTNVAEDHMGLKGIHTLEDLAAVKAVVAASTGRSGTVVLNADDERVARMSRVAHGRVVYFTLASGGPEASPVTARHLRNGGLVLGLSETAQGEVIALWERREIGLIRVDDIPATFGGRARVNVANALAAAAAAIGLGIDPACIREGLRTFDATYDQSPGRLNLVDVGPGRALIDYCHNAHGMAGLADFVTRLAPARTLAVVNLAGDRRAEDVVEYTAIAGRAFDEFIVTENLDLRGRAPGEMAAAIESGLNRAGVTPERISVELDEPTAVRSALTRLEPGALAVLLVDKPAIAWDAVKAHRETGVLVGAAG
jgi:cyanophycin synthetase